MKREIISLRKSPDPAKIALALQLGFRFVERKGNRYILQAKILKSEVHVHYGDPASATCSLNYCTSWVDIPLVPETYGEAQA